MEERFTENFNDVRLHDGKPAEEANRMLASRAFSFGNDIWLGSNASASDRSLIAHELTHVVQQHRLPPTGKPQEVNRSASLESEADRASRQILSSSGFVGVSSSTPPAIQRQGLTREEIQTELQQIEDRIFNGSPSPVEMEMLHAQRDLLLAELQRLTGRPSAQTNTAPTLPEATRTTQDPGEFTGEELSEEIESVRQWRLEQPQESSPEIAAADENLRRLETELAERQSLGIESDLTVNEIARLQREGVLPAPTDLLSGADERAAMGAGLAGSAFTTFLSAAASKSHRTTMSASG